MADIPIINNLKNKLIPTHNKESDYDDEDIFHNDNNGKDAVENDVLAQFRIQPYTELDSDILTPTKLSKVQFNTSEPKGFSFKQVESFHAAVVKSSQWYIDALEKRDRDVHKLATEVDKYKTDYQNTRFQLELLQGVGGQAMVNDSGDYVTESQLNDDQLKVVELEQKLAAVKDELLYEKKVNSDLRDQLESQPAAAAPVLTPTIAAPVSASGHATNAEIEELQELRTRQEELDIWEQQVIEEYNRLEGELELAKSTADASTNEIARLEGELANLREQTVNISALQELKSELEVALSERDEAYVELEDLKNQEPLVVQDANLVNEVSTLTTQVNKLQNDLNEKDQFIEELNTHIDVLEKSVENAESNPANTGISSGIGGYRHVDGITPADLGLE